MVNPTADHHHVRIGGFSYRYIEQPFRNAKTSNKKIFLAGGLGLFLGTFFTLGTFQMRKYLFMGGAQVYENNQTVHHQDLQGNTSKKLIVLGDSHAGALAGLFEKLHQLNGYTIKMHSRGANLPKAYQPEVISGFLEAGLQYYKHSLRPGDTILAIRITKPTYGLQTSI